ncbi:hypothetical protein A5N15_02960 [Rothia kristinae]|uniref:Uncharacterized protein n=1 Tax=Rothia kristinae TaxID=37923 RepID=A0A657IVD8_9MICC|nr:hypothetical protein A5N15_02960 [Rothia kristinae]
MRVPRDPSEMIFSGPIRSSPSGSCSGEHSRSPVRSPASTTSSRCSWYTPVRTRSRFSPAARRSGQTRWLAANSRSTRPTTPREAASRSVCGMSRAVSGMCRSSWEYRGNQRFSDRAPSVSGAPSSRRAVVLSQPLCMSPLISTTGRGPVTASSSATVGWRGHTEER